MPATAEDQPPVVVVGAGPTGVTVALALARRGVAVVLLERHPEIYALPRAVHLDDEVFRLLSRLGIGRGLDTITRPAAGLRLLDRRHRTLAEFVRRPAPGPHGHAGANLFDQPELERLLRAELGAHVDAVLRTQMQVVRVEPGPPHGPVTVVAEDRRTGRTERLAAAAVLGCDGSDSLVRAVVGAGWDDLRFTERWLVVDVRSPVPLDAWAGVHQVCDPHRAATFLQVGADRYRWEFQLRDGESAVELGAATSLAELVRPWTREIPFQQLTVLRSSEYVFRARLADRWREGRVFLLGDAAHQTPPFVGQGLGMGMRDADNLAWKLAAVLQGRAPDALLDTYEAERLPHARALIRQAVLAGWAMTGGHGTAAAVRRALLAGLCRLPGPAERALDRGTPALRPGPLVPRARRPGRQLVGSLVPQPRVRARTAPRGVLLDELLGPGFAVVTSARVDPALRTLAAQLGAPLLRVSSAALSEAGDHHVHVERDDDGGLGLSDEGALTLCDDGGLTAWLHSARVSTAVLRPDRVVLATATSSTTPGVQLWREHPDVLRLVGAARPA